MPSQRIGPYEVERELGAGGMGTVYLARHVESGRIAAVKVLPPGMSREPGFIARFTREIHALQQVVSPHIVQLYESGVDGETYFYAMEYVEGETLTERLERDSRLPWREVVEYGVQVCRALKSAHNAGIIHRDLKPSNLLLTPDGQVKLTDFGVAQVFAGDRLTATGGIVGTAEFMAPEQAEGKRATKQSDIYALGAVMYVMLTGRPPFTGKSALDIAQKHRFGQFDSPRRFVTEIPSWLDEVVCKCLAKNPDHRYPDAYVLSLRLAEIPRKVDLAGSADGPVAGASDSTVETVAANLAGGAAAADQVGGTFVRDIVRAELDRSTSRSRVEGWLDSTWILLLLLSAVLAGGYWLFQRRTADAERLFAEGERLMQGADRAAWVEAERSCFAPLMAMDAETWGPRLAPYRDRIALAQSEQEILRRLRRRGAEDAASDGSEPLRLLARVRRDVELGDVSGARTRLTALLQLLPTGPDHAPEREVVAHLLEHLPPSPFTRDNPLLGAAFEQADEWLAAGETSSARAVWTSVVTLYGDEPAAAEAVQKAKQLLRQYPEAASGIPAEGIPQAH